MSQQPSTSLRDRFNRIATRLTGALGSPFALVAAVSLIVVWAITGPLFNFSEGWQLIINTGTTIITFLMVFLIQNTQNRDTEALQLKLDELLRAVAKARGEFIGIEHLSEKQVEEIRSALEKETSGRSGTKAPPNRTVEQLLRRF